MLWIPLVLAVLTSLAAIYHIDSAYQAHLERAPLRELVYHALYATLTTLFALAVWIYVFLSDHA